MCFYISKRKNEMKIRTANKNIVCYKYGYIPYDDIFQSQIQGFRYQINAEYDLKGSGGRGEGKLRPKYGSNGYNVGMIEKGFHSFINIAMAKFDGDGRSIVKCIIPKGAKYFINSDHKERVSNKIIIKEIIK